MNKQEFLKRLKSELKHLQKEDLDAILEDYEEHFEIGLKEGRSEKELIRSLGNPKTIAKHVNADLLIKKAETKHSFTNISRAILAIFGLGFFNLIFVFGIFMGLLGVLIGLYGVTVGLVIGGIATLLIPFVAPFAANLYMGINPIAAVLTGIGITALGFLSLIGNVYITKGFYYLTLKYLKLNIKIITGRD